MQMKPVALFALWTAPFLAAQTTAVQHKPPRTGKSLDPFLNGAPFSLEQALRLLHQSAIPLPRRKEAIQNRGLDFVASAEAIDKLKAAGASEEMLKVIKGKARTATASILPPPPSPPPPPPKREPKGDLTITCAPAECEVSLNGVPRGSTTGGTLGIGLPPGDVAVDFKKDGYVGHQATVTVEADKTVSTAAVLDPNRATQEAFGAQLFQKVIQAMGGPDGVKELASVQASGSTTIWTCDSRSVRLTLFMRNRPDRAFFQAAAGKGVLNEVLFVGGQYYTSKKKAPDALEMATDFGLIRDHQLSALVAKLQGPALKLLASHAAPALGEEFSLFAEGGNEKISIGLDGDLLPQRVRIVTASGVGSETVTYSDYSRDGKAPYPKSMQIKPDGWQHGIEVRFDTVQLNPKLNDNDFRGKGKLLANLGN